MPDAAWDRVQELRGDGSTAPEFVNGDCGARQTGLQDACAHEPAGAVAEDAGQPSGSRPLELVLVRRK